jgi:NusA-like KH domain protein
MARIIDMQLMRYINLFERSSGVRTSDCFVYNNTIYYAVSKDQVFRAIGKNGENIKRIVETLRRKIKVVPFYENFESFDETKQKEALKEFIKNVVEPVEITNFEFKDGFVSFSGTRESKAILIGRDRSREKELAEVLARHFNVKGLKIA